VLENAGENFYIISAEAEQLVVNRSVEIYFSIPGAYLGFAQVVGKKQLSISQH